MWQDWFAHVQVEPANAFQGPRFDSFAMILEAVQAHMGAALLPRFLVAGGIARGELVQLAPQGLPGTRGDQHPRVVGKAANQRSQSEECHAKDIHAPPPQQISAAPAQQKTSTKGHAVAADDPLQVLSTQPKARAHRVECHEDDGRVERNQELRQ